MEQQQPEKKHKRRVRYKGTHPRRFEEKYKEELIEAGINENNIKAYGFAFEGKNVLILD